MASMNLLRQIQVKVRKESVMGESLKTYEGVRYTADDYRNDYFITVPPNAPTFADVSFYQAGMNWDIYPHDAVILRVGQNVWKDPEFETFYAEAKARGILVGGYWFFDGRATPQQQADIIIQALQGKTLELEMFIDWERSYGGANEGLKNVVKLMSLCEGRVNAREIGLYTGYYWFTENARTTDYNLYLSHRPLWIAWYSNPSVVKVPAPWGDWTHWQYGTPAVSWGQPSAEIDANRYNGTPQDFVERYGGTTPPPTGEPMEVKYKADLKAGFTSNVRSGAGTSYNPPIGVLTGPVTVDIVSEKTVAGGYDWYQISAPLSGWIALTTSYENFRAVTQTEKNVFEQYVNGVLKLRITGGEWEVF